MNFLKRICCIAVALIAAATTAEGAALDLSMRHTFGGEPLLLDSLRYKNAVGETLSITRLSYLLSGFAVQGENGEWIELPGQFAWIDAGARRTSARLPEVPVGKYRALRFFIGPDAKTNAAEAGAFPADHPLNPNLNGLHWSWQGGYIFLSLEGRFRTAADAPLDGFAYHLARDPHRTSITLAAALDLTQDAAVQLDFDIAALLRAPRPLSFASDGTATHSRDGDPVCAALMANLPGAFSVSATTGAAPTTPAVTRVAPLDLPAKFTPYRFKVSRTFPPPKLPNDNPLIEERVALGAALFKETALSRDGSISCASCHRPDTAFSDNRATSPGMDARTGRRNAMPLTNLAWKSAFFWDGRAPSLRAQVLMPIQDHAEMDESLDRVAAKLAVRDDYRTEFRAAFGSGEISAEKLALALEQYLLTLTANHSKFDRMLRGEEKLSDEEQHGFELFMTEYDPRTGKRGADCFHCHGGPLFTDNLFHNNGLAPDRANPDIGLGAISGNAADAGKFATPSLRNVARTAPYMHDGRFATLEEVVAHYCNGVERSETLDPNLAKHPAAGLPLTTEDQRALVAFLKSLTDAP